jgi:hypothetical protein
MKIITGIAIASLLTLVTMACVAQEEEDEGPRAFTYATYFNCPGGSLERADEIIAGDAERWDGFVEDGTVSAWGYLSHHTGGHWQRIFYYQAESMEALLDAYDSTGEGADAEAGREFGRICNSHDDYIWQVENGSQGEGRGEAGFSVYHVCDMLQEDRVDEIVADHMAPILNGLVEDGKLTSWGWSSHVVGGKFRKLQTMTAADFKTLLAARGEAIQAMYGDGAGPGAEFSEICGSHVDYMWNITHETP